MPSPLRDCSRALSKLAGSNEAERMTIPAPQTETQNSSWPTRQVYGMAVGCLLLGLVIGYLFRGSASPATASAAPAQSADPHSPQGMQQMPTLDQLKSMGDKKAAPLLEKLKTDPENAALLAQIGTIYKATHQFKDAEDYYGKSLKADPKNVATRGDLAACLYFAGDIDGAIDQLDQSLRISPKDANSLFNLGVMRWQGKKDAAGAISAWRELLKTNPELATDKKSQVEKMIAELSKPPAKVQE
jgi:cytochrome c-type biogenesis protein CcmH/NrfG